MQGLREAKALLDEGVLSQDEFNTEKAELVKQREERKAAAEGGVPPPPSSLPPSVQQHPPPPGPQAGQAGAAGALAPSVARGSKRSRDDAYTVPPGLRDALKPLSKMPGRENMGDSRVRCALCTQKGSVYCLECTKAKGTGIYALCCPSSGRICACLHWSDMVTGHVATWLPYGRAPPEAEGAAGARKTPPAGGKSKGTGRPRGRPVGWRKNKGGAEAGSAGGGSATGGSSDSGIGAAALVARPSHLFIFFPPLLRLVCHVSN